MANGENPEFREKILQPGHTRGGAPQGNQNAKKAKIWEQAIKRALARASNKDIDSGLDTIADKVVELAAAGEPWAVTEIGNRMDGKAVQPVSGDEDGPPLLFQKIERVIVDPATGSS